MVARKFKKPWPMYPVPDKLVLLKRDTLEKTRVKRIEIARLEKLLALLEEKL